MKSIQCKYLIFLLCVVIAIGSITGCMFMQKDSNGSDGQIGNVVDNIKAKIVVTDADKMRARENCSKGVNAIFNYDDKTLKECTDYVHGKRFHDMFRKVVYDKTGVNNFDVNVSVGDEKVIDKDTICFDVTINYLGTTEFFREVKMKRDGKSWKMPLQDFFKATGNSGK